MTMKTNICLIFAMFVALSCSKPAQLSMIVVAPGHFHASLLQKNSLDNVSDTVRVFAEPGSELEAYISKVIEY